MIFSMTSVSPNFYFNHRYVKTDLKENNINNILLSLNTLVCFVWDLSLFIRLGLQNCPGCWGVMMVKITLLGFGSYLGLALIIVG